MRIPTPGEGLYDSFNARFLSPISVAKTFVPPPQFGDITKQAHTVIVGPRGTGKTTLLKMLHPAALATFSHEDAEYYRSRVDYTGVFIGTDRSWREQLNCLGGPEIDPDLRALLSKAAFVTHILRSLVDSMLYRCRPQNTGRGEYRRAIIDRKAEAYVVKSLAGAWRVSVELPSFEALKHALRIRLLDINVYARRMQTAGVDEWRREVSKDEGFHLDFLEAASTGVELFDDAVSEPDARWALLFDELEIAPDWVLDELAQSLRSANQKFLFKMSLSPVAKGLFPLNASLGASQGHDFDAVALWYAHKEEGLKFSVKLFESLIQNKGISAGVTPEDVFGTSMFDVEGVASDRQGGYSAPNGRQYKILAELKRLDPSFESYLERQKVEIEDLPGLPEFRRAEVRKLIAIVTTRLAFRLFEAEKGTQTRQQYRSRKNPDLYSGAKTLFAIVEGNPRLLIAIVGQLLQFSKQSNVMVPRHLQSRECQEAANRFRLFLKTIPYEDEKGRKSQRGLLSLIDRIGSEMFAAVCGPIFNPEPALSFVVDDRVDDKTVEVLEQAVNAGAIILVPKDKSSIVVSSLRGERFRLSYLLAPFFRLPVLLGNEKSLSRSSRVMPSVSQFKQDKPSPQGSLEGL